MDWSKGSVTTVAGSGAQDFKDGKCAEASFNHPAEVAMDPSGQLIVLDSDNQCVRCVDMQGEKVSTLAGTPKEQGNQNGFAHQATFKSPRGLVAADDGTIFVADCDNHVIRKITKGPERKVATVAGTGKHGFKDGPPSEACFKWPWGLALDKSGAILVADHGNHRVRRIVSPPQDEKDQAVTGNADDDQPVTIRLGQQATDARDGEVTTVAGSGQQGNKDDGTKPALEASFNFPRVVAVGSNGHMMVVQNERLCRITENYQVSTVVNDLSNYPNGLIVDCRGNAIVADTCVNKIVFCSHEGEKTVIAGSGLQAHKDGPSSEASFAQPWGLALDHQGRVIVADWANHRVRALSLPGTKRLQEELANIHSPSSPSLRLPPGCNVTRSAKNLFKWSALLQVAEGPFRGGLFELTLEMAFDYPFSAPLIKFVSPISHPNVNKETREVSVAWNYPTSSIVSALRDLQALLEYPISHIEAVNKKALEVWNNNRLEFDNIAYEAVKQSWRDKLKPSETSEMLCDMLCPPKKLSREAQSQLFQTVAKKEIEEYAEKEFPPPEKPKTSPLNPKEQEAYVNKVKQREQDIKTRQSVLELNLAKALCGLAQLENPRLEQTRSLEENLARLRIEETIKKEPETGKQNLQASKECFTLLVCEADHEATRLGREVMKSCLDKYNLLYSRIEKVHSIEECVKPNAATSSRYHRDIPQKSRSSGFNKLVFSQPLDGSVGVLIAQAKHLENNLRGEFEKLVGEMNNGQEQENRENAEAKKPPLLCLSSGLLAEVHFGPGKSLSRAQEKCVKSKPSSVLDYCRLTVVFADPMLLARFHDKLRKNNKIKVVRVKNKFKQEEEKDNDKDRALLLEPPDVHINFEFEGHVCEVQLMLEEFLLIKNYSHKPYEISRLVPTGKKPVDNGDNKPESKDGQRPQKAKTREELEAELKRLLEKTKAKVDQMGEGELASAIERVIAGGVYCLHPGPASFPSSSPKILMW